MRSVILNTKPFFLPAYTAGLRVREGINLRIAAFFLPASSSPYMILCLMPIKLIMKPGMKMAKQELNLPAQNGWLLTAKHRGGQ